MKATMRAIEAAERRQQRDAKKRERELERQAKEMAKLSALEQARLEMETYENALEVLLSVHKEQAETFDWLSFATALPPVPPRRQSHNELKARQRLAVSPSRPGADLTLEQAQHQDESEYQTELQKYNSLKDEWTKMRSLASRVLQGDAVGYIEAIEELSPFTELSGIGSSLQFTIHNARLVEVVLSTNGRKAIPAEVKSLTASGKVSIKSMPKPQFIDIYQDYICGCVLRVARELFALLPIEMLLISASAEAIDTINGQTVERPFLSVAIPRVILKMFDFDKLDPSDSIMSLTHRGDLKASRKTGDFEFITPLTVSDLSQESPANMDLKSLIAAAQRLRADLAAQCAALNPEPAEAVSTNREA